MHRRGLQCLPSTSSAAPTIGARRAASSPLVTRRHRSERDNGSLKKRHEEERQRSRQRDLGDPHELVRRVTEVVIKRSAEFRPGWRETESYNDAREDARLRDRVERPLRANDTGEPVLREFNEPPRSDRVKPSHAATRQARPGTVRTEEELQLMSQPGPSDAYEQEEFAGGVGEEWLTPGSFVEIRRNGAVGIGVVLYESIVNNRMVVVSLQRSGNLWEHSRADIALVIPSFIDRDLVARCGQGMISETVTPKHRAARLEVLRRMIDLDRALEDVSNALAKPVSELYARVRHADPTKWAEVTLPQLVGMVKVKVASPILKTFAVHKHLMQRVDEFVADPVTYRVQQSFRVRPQEEVALVERVREMVRKRHPAIASFTAKAKRLIARAETAERDTWSEPAQPGVPDTENAYTPDEQAIATFLRLTYRKRRWIQRDHASLTTHALVQNVLDLGAKAVDEDVLHSFMTKLGIIAPWQDHAEMEDEINNLGSVRPTAEGRRKEEAIVSRWLEERDDAVPSAAAGSSAVAKRKVATKPVAGQVLGPEDLYSQDPADAIRHDFGDLNVFVVDDAGAQELDDGLSVEADPNDPKSHWLHVHIADPTAVIPPTHIFAQRARQLISTRYWTQGTVPMLPDALMPQGLSLGSNLARGLPERVLTFSARVDGDGNIADYKVRAGLVRNVRILRYDDVGDAIGMARAQTLFPFGRTHVPEPESRPVNRAFLPELRTLATVSERLTAARLRLPIFGTYLPEGEVVTMQRALPPSPADYAVPQRFAGFPALEYMVTPNAINELGSRHMIAECMQAACRVASRFAVEHRLPILRRAGAQYLTPSDDAFQQLLDSRNASGNVDYITAACLGAVMPPAGFSLEPAEHWQLGVPAGEGYARVTSPLRRFSDLAAHWQLKSALLGARPAFDRPASRALLADVALREGSARTVNTLHQRFWTLSFLRRWLGDPARATRGEGPDIRNLHARLMAAPSPDMINGGFSARVWLPQFAMVGSLVDAPAPEDAPVGMRVRVKLERVEIGYNPRLVVKPAA